MGSKYFNYITDKSLTVYPITERTAILVKLYSNSYSANLELLNFH